MILNRTCMVWVLFYFLFLTQTGLILRISLVFTTKHRKTQSKTPESQVFLLHFTERTLLITKAAFHQLELLLDQEGKNENKYLFKSAELHKCPMNQTHLDKCAGQRCIQDCDKI